MAALMNTIKNTVNSLTGLKQSLGLEDFLSKFGSSAGNYVDSLDPLTTFDVYFIFYPNKISNAAGDKEPSEILKAAAKNMLTNAANNITGGLFADQLNKVDSLTDLHKKRSEDERNNESSIYYMLTGNRLTSGTDSIDSTGINFGYYILSMTIPLFKILGETKTDLNYLGSVPILGTAVVTDNNSFLMDILNTKASIIERIFYPWLKEVTLPYWSYSTLPYTTATVVVDFSLHADVRYVFVGVRPMQLLMILPDQLNNGEISRQATFAFDLMYVESDLKTIDSTMDKLLGAGGSLVGAAGKMLNM